MIVHVIPHDGIGGVEVAARSMLARAPDACAFYLVPIAGRPTIDSLAIVASRFGRADDPLAHFAAVRTVLRLRPDVLICSLWRSVLVCALVKLLRPRTRLVFFLHSDRPVHLVDRALSGLGSLLADQIWADSDVTLAARVRPDDHGRIVSFVTERLMAGLPPAMPMPRFACWARIVPQKRIDRAIALVGLLVARGIDAQFDVYGPDGGAQADLESQVDRLGLRNHVRFRGPADRAALAGIAAENSFFLQLSDFEGMAMGAVEAMQLGLVPVVTPAGQMARYVGADTGVRVDPEDLPAAADRIAALLGDPAGYRRLRDAAIAYWQAAPLYADHVVAYARDLAGRKAR